MANQNKLKYQSEIDNLPNDFTGFEERNIICYRWTFEDISHPNNFLPRYILKPESEMPRITFLGWGLSLFSTPEKAKNRLKEIAKGKKNIFKALGTHVSEGRLIESDGISDSPIKNGHFTHFEYFDVNLQDSFKVIMKCDE